MQVLQPCATRCGVGGMRSLLGLSWGRNLQKQLPRLFFYSPKLCCSPRQPWEPGSSCIKVHKQMLIQPNPECGMQTSLQINVLRCAVRGGTAHPGRKLSRGRGWGLVGALPKMGVGPISIFAGRLAAGLALFRRLGSPLSLSDASGAIGAAGVALRRAEARGGLPIASGVF